MNTVKFKDLSEAELKNIMVVFLFFPGFSG